MTWTRLDDKHFQRPEAFELTDRARLLEVAALVWSNTTGADGAIPRRALLSLSTITDHDAAPVDTYAAELVAVGLWEATDGGWQVARWDELQPTAEQVEARKAATRETSERFRRHGRGDHSMCDRCAFVRSQKQAGDASPSTSRDASGDVAVTVSRPDPTRPVPTRSEAEGEGREGSARAARSSAPPLRSGPPPADARQGPEGPEPITRPTRPASVFL